MENTTGIILAGGQSRRMGKDKGLVVFHDRPLIRWALDVFENMCDEILISSNSSAYNYLGYKVIADIYPDSGPMGGIYSCLAESSNRKNLVLSCDMPFVNQDIFRLLDQQIGDAMICVPWYKQDHYEPLCGIYMQDTMHLMKLYIDQKNYKIPELFEDTYFKAFNIQNIHRLLGEHYFFNINSRADLEFAEGLQAR